jgi:hypothetical protein
MFDSDCVSEDYSFSAEFGELSTNIAELQEEIDAALAIAKDMMWEQNILRIIAHQSGNWENYITHHDSLTAFLLYRTKLVAAHARMVTDFGLYLEAATLSIEPLNTIH